MATIGHSRVDGSVTGVCELSHSVVSDSLPMDCSPPGSSVGGIFTGKNSGASCCFLLQGIELTSPVSPILAG